jgi:hypothetical protein
MMRKGNIDFTEGENDLSALISHLLNSRLLYINWQVPTQLPGGYTDQGNPGERDFVVQRNLAAIAIIEAVVSGRKIDRNNLTFHFQKLFKYERVRLYFHLTYAYTARLDTINNHLRLTSQRDVPSNFQFVCHKDIHANDNRPSGFIAEYKKGGESYEVVFLVLDMSQMDMREPTQGQLKSSKQKSSRKTQP